MLMTIILMMARSTTHPQADSPDFCLLAQAHPPGLVGSPPHPQPPADADFFAEQAQPVVAAGKAHPQPD